MSVTSNLASIVVAPTPVPLKYHYTGNRQATALDEQQFHNLEVVRKVFDLSL